jgi:predicted MFS family arabinose efflux permease
MLANTANITDRNIFSILLPPIKAQFGLSDSSLAVLHGLPFYLVYVLLGLPVAVLVDRSNRRNIIAAALLVFSAMIVFCGLAGSFLTLFIARMGVAVGESGCSAPSQSLISDICPPAERGRGMSVYAVGMNLGILFGMLLGGWVSQYWGWHVALIVAGGPGVIIALVIFFTMREPPRGRFEPRQFQSTPRGFVPVLRIFAGRPACRHSVIAAILVNIAAAPFFNWTPSYLSRSFGLSSAQIGTVLALSFGLFGGISAFVYGSIYDRARRKDVIWQTRLPALCCIVTIPFVVALYATSHVQIAIAMILVPTFLFSGFTGPLYVLVHSLVLPEMRATASALLLALTMIIGQAIGVQFSAVLSDWFAPWAGQDSLRYAMLLMVIFVPWATLHFWLAGKALQQDISSQAGETGAPQLKSVRLGERQAVLLHGISLTHGAASATVTGLSGSRERQCGDCLTALC